MAEFLLGVQVSKVTLSCKGASIYDVGKVCRRGLAQKWTEQQKLVTEVA